jgi:hypothetical protein
MSQKIITKEDIQSVDASQVNESADKSFISTTEKSKLSSITAIFTTELKALYDAYASAISGKLAATKEAIEGLLTGIITSHNHYIYDQIALSNNGADATDLSVGVKLTETVTHAATWQDIAASVATAPTGGTLIVNIKKNGTSIFSTLVSIDATEKTSVTAATPYVFTTNPTVWAVGDVREYSISQVGAIVAGKGLITTVKKTT